MKMWLPLVIIRNCVLWFLPFRAIADPPINPEPSRDEISLCIFRLMPDCTALRQCSLPYSAFENAAAPVSKHKKCSIIRINVNWQNIIQLRSLGDQKSYEAHRGRAEGERPIRNPVPSAKANGSQTSSSRSIICLAGMLETGEGKCTEERSPGKSFPAYDSLMCTTLLQAVRWWRVAVFKCVIFGDAVDIVEERGLDINYHCEKSKCKKSSLDKTSTQMKW